MSKELMWIIQRCRDEDLRHKSKRISQKVPLPQESREYLDQYLETRDTEEDSSLFVNRYGTRLQALDMYRICQRVLKHASAFCLNKRKCKQPSRSDVV
jgi:integrase/recombinase XerD